MAILLEQDRLNQQQIQDIASLVSRQIRDGGPHISPIKYIRVGRQIAMGGSQVHIRIARDAGLSLINVFSQTRNPDRAFAAQDAGHLAFYPRQVTLYDNSLSLETADENGQLVRKPDRWTLQPEIDEFYATLGRLRQETCAQFASVFANILPMLVDNKPFFAPPITLAWTVRNLRETQTFTTLS